MFQTREELFPLFAVVVRLGFEQIQHPIADSRLDMLDCESHDFEGSIRSLCKSNAADLVVPWCTFHNLRRHGPSASHLWPVRRKRFVYVANPGGQRGPLHGNCSDQPPANIDYFRQLR